MTIVTIVIMIMTITDWHYKDFKNEETFLQFSQRG